MMGKMLQPVLLLFMVLSQASAQQNFPLSDQQNLSITDPFSSYAPFFYPDIRTPPEQFGSGDSGFGGGMFGSGSGGMPKLYILYIITPSAPKVYWKDWTYDVYTGSGWSTSGNGSWSKAPAGSKAAQFQVYRVVHPESEDIALIKPSTPGSDVLESTFVPNESVRYSISGDSYNDHMLTLNPASEVSFVYNATFYNMAPAGRVGAKSDIPAGIYLLNTALPDNFPDELRKAAANLTDPSLDMLKQALKTRNFVKRHVNYNLSWGSSGLPAPGDDIALWTYTHRQGICGHYATLFAVLLRAQGIPARVATGYAGGLEEGNYTVILGSYAHAWTEVYIPPYGWMPIDATGTSNATGNETANETEEVKLQIDWSSVGKTTLDLQYSLDQQTQSRMNQSQKNELGKLNRSNQQPMNLSDQRNFNSSSFNWSSPMNRSAYNYSGLNYSQYNRSAWNATLRNQTNRTNQYNQTNRTWQYNQTNNTKQNWTKKNESEEQQKKQELEKTANEGLPGKLSSAIASAISATPPWLIIAAVVVIAALLAIIYLFRPPAANARLKKPEIQQKAEIRRWVDIDAVIAKVRAMGAEGKKGEAVVYGYNELADYVAYILSVSNEPSLTAREFANRALAQKKADEAFLKQNVPVLKAIVFIFEDTEYGERVSDAQFSAFVAALEKLAGK